MKTCLLIVCILGITSLFLVSVMSVNAEVVWVQKQSMPSARAGLGVVEVNGTIYAVGGWNQPPTNTTQAYNIANNSWTLKASMPTARMLFGIAVYQDKIYAIGGKVNQIKVTNATEAYDPTTDTWTTKAALPTPSFGFKANVVNDKIYVIAGVQQITNTTIKCLNFTRVYDPAIDTWTTKAAIPNPVFNYGSAVVGNKIYIISGDTLTSNGTLIDTNLIQIYDTQTDSWSTGAAIPVAVNAPAAVTANDSNVSKIYVLGGGSDKLQLTYNLTQIYDPQQDVWANGAAMPTSRFTSGACIANQTLYVIGGADNLAGTADVYALDLANQIPEFPSWMILPLVLMTAISMSLLIKEKWKRVT
jgi:N-acetylneuraminic acid mutarotase